MPSRADSHGKRAPRRPSVRGRSRAAGRRRTRYSSIARAAGGCVAARNGSTKTSLSQKTWPRYAGPLRPRAPTAASPASPTDAIRWKSAKRTARWSSASPSIDDVGARPAPRPRRAVLAQQPLEPGRSRSPSVRTRALGRRGRSATARRRRGARRARARSPLPRGGSDAAACRPRRAPRVAVAAASPSATGGGTSGGRRPGAVERRARSATVPGRASEEKTTARVDAVARRRLRAQHPGAEVERAARAGRCTAARASSLPDRDSAAGRLSGPAPS